MIADGEVKKKTKTNTPTTMTRYMFINLKTGLFLQQQTKQTDERTDRIRDGQRGQTFVAENNFNLTIPG